ncbi:38076_t:CDS:2, partial [Gigaspora margarita]
ISDLTKEYEKLFQLKSILEVSESTLSNKIRSLEAKKGRNKDEITCLKNNLKQLYDEKLERENLELLKQKKYCKK